MAVSPSETWEWVHGTWDVPTTRSVHPRKPSDSDDLEHIRVFKAVDHRPSTGSAHSASENERSGCLIADAAAL
jgi:hypothetical protein